MGTNRWINNFVKEFPIPEVAEESQSQVVSVVDKILTITRNSDYLNDPTKQVNVRKLEAQIDQMVYDLYGLTDDEVAIVEGHDDGDNSKQ